MAGTPPYTPAQLKQVDERIGIIQIISGRTAAGEDFYAYVSVRPSMYEEFVRNMVDGKRMNVESFGKILRKGFGKEPPEDVKHYMEEQYGVDHDFIQHLSEEVQKRQQEAQKKKK